jgi:hypothetical protein
LYLRKCITYILWQTMFLFGYQWVTQNALLSVVACNQQQWHCSGVPMVREHEQTRAAARARWQHHSDRASTHDPKHICQLHSTIVISNPQNTHLLN